jgi:tRNA pseudouridine-54 N-methylase
VEKVSYIESEDRLVIETIYDAEPAILEAKEARDQGGVMVGSKGQQMLKAAVIPLEHIVALQNMGYDLLSPDPAEFRRALVYIQTHQQQFMATDKKVFSTVKPKWE